MRTRENPHKIAQCDDSAFQPSQLQVHMRSAYWRKTLEMWKLWLLCSDTCTWIKYTLKYTWKCILEKPQIKVQFVNILFVIQGYLKCTWMCITGDKLNKCTNWDYSLSILAILGGLW